MDVLKDIGRMTPTQRIEYLKRIVELCINATPSGDERNLMADSNIALMGGLRESKDSGDGY